MHPYDPSSSNRRNSNRPSFNALTLDVLAILRHLRRPIHSSPSSLERDHRSTNRPSRACITRCEPSLAFNHVALTGSEPSTIDHATLILTVHRRSSTSQLSYMSVLLFEMFIVVNSSYIYDYDLCLCTLRRSSWFEHPDIRYLISLCNLFVRIV
jgi:hypothetical protein